MSKNREGVLIHTYGPEFHSELLVLVSQAHRLAKLMDEHFRVSPYKYTAPYVTELQRTCREFALLKGRLRKVMAELEEPPQ